MYHMIFPHTSGGEWRSPQIPRTFTKDEIEWGKMKYMIFNFTKNYQLTTKLNVNDVNFEIPRETKLIGTMITWDRNFKETIQKNATSPCSS